MGYNLAMPIAPMIPPQMTGSARRSGCAVRAPKLAMGSLRIAIGNGVPTGLIHQVVTDIFNTLMMLQWGSDKPPAAQSKLWSTGPYGEPSVSLETFFGPYSARGYKQLEAQVGGMFQAFKGRQPLTIKMGAQADLDTQKGLMTLAASTSLENILGMLAAAVGIRQPERAARFIRQRAIAAENCIVSDAQM